MHDIIENYEVRIFRTTNDIDVIGMVLLQNTPTMIVKYPKQLHGTYDKETNKTKYSLIDWTSPILYAGNTIEVYKSNILFSSIPTLNLGKSYLNILIKDLPETSELRSQLHKSISDIDADKSTMSKSLH